jgi:nucleotide-binding universal stress UspA family protein
MIKDVMVRLDGTPADDARLAAAADVAALFDGHLIGLFLNVLPLFVPPDGVGTVLVADVIDNARRAGDETAAALLERLRRIGRPAEVRRFDTLPDVAPEVAAREARSADAFIDLRPDPKPAGKGAAQMVEAVLFGAGRHLLLIAQAQHLQARHLRDGFAHAVVAWNGSREAARGLAEALPYLHKACAASVVVVSEVKSVEDEALVGPDAVTHLRHHGIEARLHRAKAKDGEIGPALMREAHRLRADLLVMGGYGHSRVRERLLGGASRYLLEHADLPLVIAH